ncbi:acetamidase [Komagataeibacter xylinus]|nr:Acetamidase/Formamidase [Komagataeibacter xylinus E25]RFP01097.1 acetamidase [Komagataeibacter xylinus]RFP04010.1 acetamidase [Komagataeibacter xylinus]
MCIACNHTIHRNQKHFGWDHDFLPTLTGRPGETLCFECTDASDGQIGPDATAETLNDFDFSKINPVTGPYYVEGARPGDALKVTLREFQPSGTGWTANIPGFGLLSDQFPAPALHLWSYDAIGLTPALYGPGGRVPLKPFIGTIGVAPAEDGLHSIIPPRRVGGNMDIRDLSVGSTLYLPVEVEGALLSIGDTHAAQGDGEVCGTAIESRMNVAVTVDLIKDARLQAPRFTTSGPVTNHLDHAGYEVTIGIAPDLLTAARESLIRMIDLLERMHHMSPVDAYMLCSVCGDLRINEIVNRPNFLVSFYFPRAVFY